MLVLFDIDQTLIETGRVGLHAIERAGTRLFRPNFTTDGIDVSGRLDPGILIDILSANGLDPTPEHAAALRRVYREELERMIAEKPGRALPGAKDLVKALGSVTLGLMTGNFEETGRLKLTACGIDADRFPVRVWGDDGPDPRRRDLLTPVAIERWSALAGSAMMDSGVEASRVTVIGDTVHDVLCALAHGCRALAVATGRYSAAELRAAGAHLVVDGLEDTEGLARWVLKG